MKHTTDKVFIEMLRNAGLRMDPRSPRPRYIRICSCHWSLTKPLPFWFRVLIGFVWFAVHFNHRWLGEKFGKQALRDALAMANIFPPWWYTRHQLGRMVMRESIAFAKDQVIRKWVQQRP